MRQLVESFFSEYLHRTRDVGRNTILAYRDALRLFFTFVAGKRHCSVADLRIEDLTADRVIEFLDYLEEDRHNSVVTRNARMTALRSFFRHLVHQDPLHAAQFGRILSLERKLSAARPTASYLEPEEIQVLLNQPDQQHVNGARDHALLLFLYNTGARISEALAIRRSDLELERPRHVLSRHGDVKIDVHAMSGTQELARVSATTTIVVGEIVRVDLDLTPPLADIGTPPDMAMPDMATPPDMATGDLSPPPELAHPFTFPARMITTWTVPVTGSFHIEATGGSGGIGNPIQGMTPRGGLAATASGDFMLSKGDELTILVAITGEPAWRSSGAHGGGGSFVVSKARGPLVVAGGGGGASSSDDGSNASLTGDGTPGRGNGGAGGMNGNGGEGNDGAGGGGLLTDGGACRNGGNAGGNGISFMNGGKETICGTQTGGGFGGGGGGYFGGGGGGGYSGGGGGALDFGGGGGGSYVAQFAANKSIRVALTEGNGSVTITAK